MQKELIWTEPKPPTKGLSYYDHTICNTPLGEFIIEWKSWKENDSYDITLNRDEWIGSEYSLEDAKERVKDFLIQKHRELSEYDCSHEIIDASNSLIQSGFMCIKCKALFKAYANERSN